MVTDVTLERLVEILHDSPRGVLIASEEMSAWLYSFSRYRARGAGSDLPSWLNMHNAGMIIPSRKSCGTKTVKHAYVCITGGIQSSLFAKLMKSDEFQASGLLARFLLVYPPEQCKQWSDAVIASKVKQGYARLLRDLSQLILRDGTGFPTTLHLVPEAQERFIQFYNHWNRHPVADAMEEVERAALWKLEGYAARLALLIHVAGCMEAGEDDTRQRVSLESMEAGIQLTEWFANEMRRCYALFAEKQEEKEQRQLVHLIQRKGGSIRARELCRANNRMFPTKAAAEKALHKLVTLGVAEWRETNPQKTAGRPARRCYLRGGELSNCVMHLHDTIPET
jgi:hypothetical protein